MADAAAQDSSSIRKARKRETDRRAQRGHRQRHKAYMLQLEERIRSLSKQHTCDDRVLALQAETDRLRETCTRLRTQLERVRLAVCADDDDRRNSSGHSLEHSDFECDRLATPSSLTNPACDHEPQLDGSTASAGDRPHDASPSLNVDEVAAVYPDASLPNVAEQDELPFTLPAFLTQGSDLRTEDDCEVPPMSGLSFLSTAAQADVNVRVEDGTLVHPFPLDCNTLPTAQLIDQSTRGRFPLPVEGSADNQLACPDSLGQHATIIEMNSDDSSPYPDLNSDISCLLVGGHFQGRYNMLPNLSTPRCISDDFVVDVLNEARKEHQQGRFSTAEHVTLRHVLSTPPIDCLSFRLFHFISNYGPMPLHVMLGIFWIQYLFLRWQVLKTATAYEQVPTFMRPSKLECVIPHQPFVGMLAWPSLREALLRDLEKTNVESLGIEALRSLNPEWSRDATYQQGMSPATIDVLEIVERQASSFGFWKINPDTFTRYPRYKQYFAV